MYTELQQYRKEAFPIKFEEARQRARDNPNSDYETKRLAYWREQNYKLKKSQNEHKRNNPASKALA